MICCVFMPRRSCCIVGSCADQRNLGIMPGQLAHSPMVRMHCAHGSPFPEAARGFKRCRGAMCLQHQTCEVEVGAVLCMALWWKHNCNCRSPCGVPLGCHRPSTSLSSVHQQHADFSVAKAQGGKVVHAVDTADPVDTAVVTCVVGGCCQVAATLARTWICGRRYHKQLSS
jgi:hypothetical protein